jgi:hypothetical protein
MNALFLYPDHAWGIGDLYGYDYDPDTQRRERFLIARPEDVDQNVVYAKERRLIEIVKGELEGGYRRCHVYAVHTQKRDVNRRLAHILECEGIRTAVLTSAVPPEKREAWIAQRLREGVQVTISHPKIVETGLDLLGHPSLFFESGYSLYTLRQASRRSWRIGQRLPVRVFCLHYEETIQSSCLRLMAKKMLVSLAMEGKFDEGGLHSFEEDDDILTAMARELVTEHGVGESADVLWRQLQMEQSRLVPPPPSVPDVPDCDSVPSVPPPLPPVITVPSLATALKFGVRPPASPSRRQEVPSPLHEQFSLF